MMTKIKRELFYFQQLLKRLGIILLTFSFLRLIFFFFNSNFFPVETVFGLLKTFVYGVRFDLAAIVYINGLFILSSIIPLRQRRELWFKKFQKVIFLIFNSIAIAFETIDVAFFNYAFRRTIGSDLSLFKNTAEMAPKFLAEFWYLLVIFFLIILTINYLYNKTSLKREIAEPLFLSQSVVFVSGLLAFGIAARGGIQLRPLMSITAAQYVEDMRQIPLMTNTSLNLIFSSQQRFLEEKKYFSEGELNEIFSIEKHPKPVKEFQKKNVFIIVLESFGKEYINTFNSEAHYTPFLDSLIKKSFYCKQSYANGLRSTQGIVAITGGIPSLMSDPLMFSAYQSNRIDGLATLLQKEGYSTSFFHGANPGSMEFERFSKLTGFQNYYDKDDYGDSDFDGQWGIWDEPFFQYTAQKLNEEKEPFLALLFSLTSHHPYKVPKEFEAKYPKEKAVFRSVRYTDFALKLFFETAEKMPWYDNTIFIILADHIGKSFQSAYKTKQGKYKIPILIFDPTGDLRGTPNQVASQIDIMPTVLDYLNYDQPYAAFGTSMFDTLAPHYAFMYSENVYQILDETYILLLGDVGVIGLYNHQSDSQLRKNLKGKLPKIQARLEKQLKAIIQTHHYKMINNELYYKN
jgi:phosphoglycerol transferase MdoB-like AlkP superfamily enzyme